MRWRRVIVAVLVDLVLMAASSVGLVSIEVAPRPIYAYLAAYLMCSVVALPGVIAAVLVYGLGKPQRLPF